MDLPPPDGPWRMTRSSRPIDRVQPWSTGSARPAWANRRSVASSTGTVVAVAGEAAAAGVSRPLASGQRRERPARSVARRSPPREAPQPAVSRSSALKPSRMPPRPTASETGERPPTNSGLSPTGRRPSSRAGRARAARRPNDPSPSTPWTYRSTRFVFAVVPLLARLLRESSSDARPSARSDRA